MDMYPPGRLCSNAYSPLTHVLFVQYVAAPHAALHLIAEDLTISIDEALEVMEDSSNVGMLLHGD
jgi:hypothetical protein